MPRRRKSSKSDGALGIIAIIIAAAVFLLKIIIVLLPFIAIGAAIYYYLKWQKRKLVEYDNDFSIFYQNELKSKLKVALIISPLLIGGIFYLNHHNQQNEKARIEKERIIEEERIEKERIEVEELKIKQESSAKFLEKAQINFDKYHYKTTLKYIDSSLTILPNNITALELKGKALYNSKQYNTAAEFYEENKIKLNRGEAYLMIAKSHRKLGNIEQAVINAYNASKEKNEEGTKLYDELNPLKSVRTGYRQRCCDGTTSYSTGKGTCSGHGGVCKWNEPIYVKRRKYKITSK